MAKDGAQEKDQSMEEILQSIKRIIAEEGEEENTVIGEDPHVRGSTVLDLTEFESPAEKQAEAASIVKGVLDLTESHETPSVPHASSHGASSSFPSPGDVLADIDSLLSDETMRASSAALKALSDVQAPARGARDVTRGGGLAFRSGGTVEDLVVEALRPMMKEWLDQNLSVIVREMVAKEIKKLAP